MTQHLRDLPIVPTGDQHLRDLPVVPTGDRVAFFGNTREGKTVVAHAELLAKPHAIVVDTKEREDWSGVGVYVIGDDMMRGDKITKGPGRYIWRPGFAWEDVEYRNRFFKSALEQGNRVIYLDEAIDTVESATKYPIWLRRCVKKGAVSHLGIWFSTQEPRGIPTWLAGQADYMFAFHTGLPEHRDRIDDFFERKLPWGKLTTRSYNFMLRMPNGVYGPMSLNYESLLHEEAIVREASGQAPPAGVVE